MLEWIHILLSYWRLQCIWNNGIFKDGKHFRFWYFYYFLAIFCSKKDHVNQVFFVSPLQNQITFVERFGGPLRIVNKKSYIFRMTSRPNHLKSTLVTKNQGCRSRRAQYLKRAHFFKSSKICIHIVFSYFCGHLTYFFSIIYF